MKLTQSYSVRAVSLNKIIFVINMQNTNKEMKHLKYILNEKLANLKIVFVERDWKFKVIFFIIKVYYIVIKHFELLVILRLHIKHKSNQDVIKIKPSQLSSTKLHISVWSYSLDDFYRFSSFFIIFSKRKQIIFFSTITPKIWYQHSIIF